MLYEIKNIDLLKNTDWKKIDKVASQLFIKIKEGKYEDHVTHEVAYNADIYSLKNNGSVIVNYGLTDGKPWLNWCGHFLETMIPWSKNVKDLFLKNNLNFINFSYFEHDSYVKPHIDGKKENEKNLGHCNINFIVSCEDTNARTWVRHEDITLSYNSIPDTAWLLDTTKTHAIENNGLRKIFQIKFHDSFDIIKTFIEKNPDILNKPIDDLTVL